MNKLNRSLTISLIASVVSLLISFYLLFSNIATQSCLEAGSGYLACSVRFDYPFIIVFVSQYFSIRFAGSLIYHYAESNKKNIFSIVLAASLAAISALLFIVIACVHFLN